MPIILRLAIAETRPVLRGFDHYWHVIRLLGDDGAAFTANAVADRCAPGVDADVRDFIRRLIKAGIADRVDGKVVLLSRPRATPSLKRDGTRCLQAAGPQQMWNVMRREVGGFTAQDLAIAATTDDVGVSQRAAEDYCVALCAAGLLVNIGGRPRAWRLTGSGNTGPKPPKVMRSEMVYDQNLERIVGDIDAEEVAS
jgi:hypothetical protein